MVNHKCCGRVKVRSPIYKVPILPLPPRCLSWAIDFQRFQPAWGTSVHIITVAHQVPTVPFGPRYCSQTLISYSFLSNAGIRPFSERLPWPPGLTGPCNFSLQAKLTSECLALSSVALSVCLLSVCPLASMQFQHLTVSSRKSARSLPCNLLSMRPAITCTLRGLTSSLSH